MNSSISVKINPRHVDLGTGSQWASKFAGWLGSLTQRATAADTSAEEGVRHLLALADAYEETQPSYAADLRAAAAAYNERSDLGRRAD